MTKISTNISCPIDQKNNFINISCYNRACVVITARVVISARVNCHPIPRIVICIDGCGRNYVRIRVWFEGVTLCIIRDLNSTSILILNIGEGGSNLEVILGEYILAIFILNIMKNIMFALSIVLACSIITTKCECGCEAYKYFKVNN